MEKQRRFERGAFVALAVAILFLYFPANLLSGNSDEFPNGRWYFAAFVIFGAVLLGCAIWLARSASSRWTYVLCACVAAYAVSIFLSDLVFPLGIGAIENGSEVEHFQLTGSIFQGLIFLLALAGLLVLPWATAARISWLVAGVFTASAIVQIATASFGSPVSAASAQDEVSAASSDDGFNIYQVVFDGYHGPWLPFTLKELGLSEAAFKDFTYYHSARSNNWATAASFPSFMSGTIFKKGETVREWRARADKESFVHDLNQRGYRTTGYALWTRFGLTPLQVLNKTPNAGVTLPLTLDFWALRVAPVVARPVMLVGGTGGFSRLVQTVANVPTGDTRTYDTYQLYKAMLADEPDRKPSGEYVILHAFPPHGPNQLDRLGKYVGKSSYDEELLLATNMMQELIARLKELGRYDNSMIIFQSDHGSTTASNARFLKDPLRSSVRIDDETASAMQKVDVRGVSGRQYDARTRALLLVKPPLSCRESARMRVDESLVQLRDLKNYIRAALADPKTACQFPTVDSVDMVHGLVTQRGPDGKDVSMGSPDLRSGRINHYRFTSDGKWHIEEDIPFEYE